MVPGACPERLAGLMAASAAFRRPRPVVCRQRGIDRNLPTKPATKIPKGARVLGAENNFVFGLKRNNEILAIAPHRNLSPVFHFTLSLLKGRNIFARARRQDRRLVSSTIALH
jgi:hypothetical protein